MVSSGKVFYAEIAVSENARLGAGLFALYWAVFV